MHRSRFKGYAYILNNYEFDIGGGEAMSVAGSTRYARGGSQVDTINVRHVFTEIGYKELLNENLKAKV